MKSSILKFIQEKGITMPRLSEACDCEDPICYVRFLLPGWEFYLFEMDDVGNFARAVVHSPYTHGWPDFGIVPLLNFAEEYATEFSDDFMLATVDQDFEPIPASKVIDLHRDKRKR